MRRRHRSETTQVWCTYWIRVGSAYSPPQMPANVIAKIKYPPDNQPPRQVKPRMSDAPSQYTEKSYNPGDTPQSTKRSMPASGSTDSLARATSPLGSSDRLAQMAQSPPISLGAQIPATTHPPRPDSQAQDAAQRPSANGPPQRPKREGDDEYRRAMSPVNAGSSSPTQPGFRVTSPNGTHPASPPQVKNGFNPSVLGTRSPSPRMRTAEADRPAPPPDAFYYGRSPTANGFNQTNRPSSIGNSADLMRELKAKEGEVETGRQREAALRVIIAKAKKAGFVLDQGEESDDEDERDDVEGDEAVVRKLTDALVRLKQEKASIQVRTALCLPEAMADSRTSLLHRSRSHLIERSRRNDYAAVRCKKLPSSVPRWLRWSLTLQMTSRESKRNA